MEGAGCWVLGGEPPGVLPHIALSSWGFSLLHIHVWLNILMTESYGSWREGFLVVSAS